MKKTQKQQQEEIHDDEEDKRHEILKAVAQAWLSHSSNKRSPIYNEYDARKRTIKYSQCKFSRFKLEMMKPNDKDSIQLMIAKDAGTSSSTSNWDFKQSLWDPYEIVTISKRLEAAFVLDYEFSGEMNDVNGRKILGRNRRSKESKNSLRNLFNKLSSRRFDESSGIH